MMAWVNDSPGVETGGILIGLNGWPNRIVVTQVTGPGPNSVRRRGYFRRDTAHCQAVLDNAYRLHGWDYVGEWHSHVIPLDRPSLGDLCTLAAIMNDPEYDFHQFALLIVMAYREPALVKAYVASGGVVHAVDARPLRSIREISSGDQELAEQGRGK